MMDDEIRGEFKEVKDSINGLTLMVEKHIAHEDGLDLDDRVKRHSEELKTKASWGGLVAACTLLIGVMTTVLIIAKGI